MPATILAIADAVVAQLNATSFSRPLHAERHYLPQFELSEMTELRVSVVPRSVASKGLDRNRDSFDYQLDVAVQQKLDPTPGNLDALVALVETFRTGNKVGRQERSECPEYFNTKPQLDKRALPDFSTAEDEALLRKQEEAAANFLDNKAMLIAKIERAFNTTYGSIGTVNDLFDPARQIEANSTEKEPAMSAVASATVVTLRASGADGGAGA